ncbi:dTDP-4-dehydrorhamnose 3,5-epimerase [Alphaproteobacteria bacterium]|nr:dTDP-4-dehydrorhamnose 3,5-epimerase [Alphaproteobacteria bacterium]
MLISETNLKGVLLFGPNVHSDGRGFFKEIFHAERYREAGITGEFVQDNYSKSKKGVLRGLHYQVTKAQGKLVSCMRGAILDVVADVNPASPTFGKYYSAELSEKNHLQLWVPPGYAHGFCVISDDAEVTYKCTEYYDPSSERGIIWNDDTLSIDWPVKDPTISPKDNEWPSLLNSEL